jgi:uncharacterized protein YecE (DUF72 family)
MARFYVGTSGWHYKHWRGDFYPAGMATSRWLEHYTRCFDTVELNASFYREPRDAAWDLWRESTPDGFCFAVKASRFLTHIRQLREPEESLERVVKGAGRLRDKLGPLLYQLPPSFQRDQERLDRLAEFLERLPEGYRHVIEFRHKSWLMEEVFELLAAHGVGFCVFDMPRMECPLRATAPFAYVRFHGATRRYGGNYSDAELAAWAERLQKLGDGLEAVYVYFNNDIGGHAPRNARTLRDLLRWRAPRS